MNKQLNHSLMLEGNVGAGKSTFLKMINDYLDIQAIFEPHQKWQNVNGENLLEKFYSDISRWAYTFQTYAFVTRVLEQEHHARMAPGAVQVLERSVYSDRYCFAKNCYEMGVMSSLEWKLYQEWFAWLVYNYTPRPTGFIYLRTDPEICYQRMHKRNRSEESSVSLDYLKKIHDKHEKWLVQKEDIAPHLKDIPVLILECDIDFEHNKQEQEKHVSRIMEFFNIVRMKPTQPRDVRMVRQAHHERT